MTGVPLIRALILSKIFFFFRFTVSTKLMMSQYICRPSPLRNPPAIFSRFLQILRSFSDILLLKGILKSWRNSRWFVLYFSNRFSSAFSSFFAFRPLVFWFASLPSSISSSYRLSYRANSSAVKAVSPLRILSFRAWSIPFRNCSMWWLHGWPVSSVFFWRYRPRCTSHSPWRVPKWYILVSWSWMSVPVYSFNTRSFPNDSRSFFSQP